MKGEDIKSNRLCEPIADTNIEGAKSTILYHWEQAKNSEKNNLYHHYQTAKAIYSAKESFCKSDEQTLSFSKFILENCGLSSRYGLLRSSRRLSLIFPLEAKT